MIAALLFAAEATTAVMLEASAESAEVLVFCSLTIAALAADMPKAFTASVVASMASTAARRFSSVASALFKIDVA